MKESTKVILVTSGISLLILCCLFLLHYYDAKILSLDNKWLLISGIPILIGLFLSGTIKNFKGFGIELESNLSEKVELDFTDTIEAYPYPGIEKGSIQKLHNLSSSEKQKVRRIQFVEGKTGYYTFDAVKQYINTFNKLQYIEIIDSNKKFIALLSAKEFKTKERDTINYESEDKITSLINNLENNMIVAQYSSSITDTINKEDTLLEAYQKFTQSNQHKYFDNQSLPVLDSAFKMVGIITRCKITEKISQKVLSVNKH